MAFSWLTHVTAFFLLNPDSDLVDVWTEFCVQKSNLGINVSRRDEFNWLLMVLLHA